MDREIIRSEEGTTELSGEGLDTQLRGSRTSMKSSASRVSSSRRAAVSCTRIKTCARRLLMKRARCTAPWTRPSRCS